MATARDVGSALIFCTVSKNSVSGMLIGRLSSLAPGSSACLSETHGAFQVQSAPKSSSKELKAYIDSTKHGGGEGRNLELFSSV